VEAGGLGDEVLGRRWAGRRHAGRAGQLVEGVGDEVAAAGEGVAPFAEVVGQRFDGAPTRIGEDRDPRCSGGPYRAG